MQEQQTKLSNSTIKQTYLMNNNSQEIFGINYSLDFLFHNVKISLSNNIIRENITKGAHDIISVQSLMIIKPDSSTFCTFRLSIQDSLFDNKKEAFIKKFAL